MGRVVRELVHIHGCQLLLDGVYNADPHPGNVLLLPDGTLGLIDYGMVGRLGCVLCLRRAGRCSCRLEIFRCPAQSLIPTSKKRTFPAGQSH